MPDGRLFRFTRLPSRRDAVFRPLITATLTGPAGSLETEMLLDSGADTSIIDLRMAERIGLDLGPIEMMAGIGADIPGYGGKALLRVERIPPEVPAVALPVIIPVDRELPSFPILGRVLRGVRHPVGDGADPLARHLLGIPTLLSLPRVRGGSSSADTHFVILI